MTFTLRTVAALTLAMAIGTGSASAQDTPVEFDAWVIPGWTFTPSIGIAGLWDSNVAVAANQAEGRTTESDRLFLVHPQGQIEFRSPRTEFVGGYRGYLRRYMTAEALNGFDQRGYLSLRHMATRRLTVHARNEFDDVPSTDEIELNGIPYARFGAQTNRFGAGAEYRLTRRGDLAVRYEHTWVDFDNDSNLYRGGTMHAVRSGYTLALTPRTRIGGEYRVRQSNLNNNARVLWFHDTGGLVEHAITRHVDVSVAVGYSQVRDPGLSGNRGGLYFRSDLSRQAERALYGVAFERSYAPSFGFGGSSSAQELRGYVYMPFRSNRLYVNGNAMWRRTNPLESGELALDSFVVDATVGYGVSRWLRLEAFHRFSRQDSRITGGEINRHRLGLQVVISQPMRIQ
jgi:hypothetical protein